MYGSAYTMEKEFYGAVIIDSGVRWNNEHEMITSEILSDPKMFFRNVA